jgi:hypothetical protein
MKFRRTRALFASLSLFSFVLQVFAPLGAFAETPTAIAGEGIDNLDLSSTSKTIQAGKLTNFQRTTVLIGGQAHSITESTMLTPAAALAVQQVLNGGSQNLILNAQHAAGGGTAVLNNAATSVSSVVVPKGVTVLQSLNDQHFQQRTHFNTDRDEPDAECR